MSPVSADDDDDVTLEDYQQTVGDLRDATFSLRQTALLLRLKGGADLERGNQLSGTAELADSVRLLMQAGMRYTQHPEDLYEVVNDVLIQLRYLHEHTPAVFQEEDFWDNLNARLNALGEPSYALAQVLIHTYLPAVQHANEIAQAEATLRNAVQNLFDAFLLRLEEEEEEGSESGEEDSESEDDESGSEDSESEEEDSEEDEDSSDGYTSSSEEEDEEDSDSYTSSEEEEEYSEPEESEYDSALSGYATDTDTSYEAFTSDEVGEIEDDLTGEDPFIPFVATENLEPKEPVRVFRSARLPYISSSSTWSWFQ